MNPLEKKVLEAMETISTLSAQLDDAKKYITLAQGMGGIAHDFNNLLMGIQGRASLGILSSDHGSENYEQFQTIAELVDKGAEYTKNILIILKGEDMVTAPHNLNRLIQGEVETYRKLFKNVDFKLDLDPTLKNTPLSPTKFSRVLQNLVVNAVYAMPEGGSLNISTYHESGDLDDLLYAVMDVKDTGTGMDEETAKKAFDLFYTTKKSGSGFGLATVKGELEGLGGRVELNTALEQGTTFRLYFPSCAGDECSEGKETIPIEKYAGKLLLYEPDENLGPIQTKLFTKLGFDVTNTYSPEDAYHKINGNGHFDILVAEPALQNDFSAIYAMLQTPKPPVLFLAGGEVDFGFVGMYGAGILKKPADIGHLSNSVKKVMNRTQYTTE